MRGISEEIIEEVRARSDIVDVISDYVNLKKSGRNYLGLCPFHKERTPSFSVSPDKQMFYCFGCQEGGDVFSFLMKQENLTFPEAVRELARRAGIHIPEGREAGAGDEKRDRLYRVLEWATLYFHHILTKRPAGRGAWSYLERRNISPETADRFQLGYAQPDWDDLLKVFLRKGVDLADLKEVGLVSEGRKRPYDRFRDRLMFPIRDRRGRTIGFGGRVLGEGEPKYLNSPETPLFNKRRVWYGLDLATQAIRREARAIVVEGYMDCIALHQAGFENAVASLGTSLSREQAEALERMCEEVIIAYDADAAGARATLRGLGLFDLDRVRVKVARIPAGEDPDSLIRRGGTEAFQRVVDEAVPLVEYVIDLADETYGREDVSAVMKCVEMVVPVLAAYRNAVERDMWIAKTAEALGANETALREEVLRRARSPRRGHGDRDGDKRHNKGKKNIEKIVLNGLRVERCERDLLKIIIQYPEVGPKVRELCQENGVMFRKKVHAELFDAIFDLYGRNYTEGDGIPKVVAKIADRVGEDARSLLGRLSVEELPYTEEEALGIALAHVGTLEKELARQRLRDIEREIKQLESQGLEVDRTAPELLKEYIDLTKKLKGTEDVGGSPG